MRSFAGLLLLIPLSGSPQVPASAEERPRAGFKVLFNFDSRRTQVDGEGARFFGFRLGAQRGRDIIALGYYGLSDPYYRNDVVRPDIGDTTDLRLGISYAGLTYERILYDSRRWQLSIPLTLGLGNVTVDQLDTADTYRPLARQEVTVVEPGVKGAFKLFFWLFLTAGAGYRQAVTQDRDARDIYSDFTWNYGISIKLGEIYRYAKRKINDRKNGQEGG
jgi:hypothetical protein